MRAEKLVCRAGQEVTIEGLDIDWAVRCEMHRVHEHARSNGMGQSHDSLDVIDRAYRVRGVADRDKLGPAVDGGAESGQIERAVLGLEANLAYFNASRS